MALYLVTAPAAEPVTTTVAKLHLRVDHSTDDTLIDTLCAAARDYVETGTRRKLITQTWDLKLNGFPSGAIWLPFPPVSSITSVSYVDTNGDSQTWNSSLYTTHLPSGPKAEPAYIVPAYGQYYPSTRTSPESVTVRFVCGYGSAGSSVPGGLLAAMKLLIGHWYANRESVVVGNVANTVAQAAESLIWQFKVT